MCRDRRTCFLILGLLGLILEPPGAGISPCVGGLEELVAVLGETPLDGALRTSLAVKPSLFAYSGAPVLSETPLSGIAGDRVALRGYNFGQPGGAGIASFNGVKTESITFWSSQRIETSLPDTASGPAARVSRPIPLPTIETEVDRIGLPGLPDPGAQLGARPRSQ